MKDPVKALEYYEQALEKKDADKENLQEKIDQLNHKGL